MDHLERARGALRHLERRLIQAHKENCISSEVGDSPSSSGSGNRPDGREAHGQFGAGVRPEEDEPSRTVEFLTRSSVLSAVAGVDTENRESAKRRKREKPIWLKHLDFEPDSREIIGCAIEVHRDLGPGFLESVYHNAMTVCLIGKAIPFESERRATIWFEGVEVGHHCLDLVIRETIVVELKAVEGSC